MGLHAYAFLRFLTGMGGIGCVMSSFVLAIEHVGCKVISNILVLVFGDYS